MTINMTDKNLNPLPIDRNFPIDANDFTRVRDNYIEDTYLNIKQLKDAGKLIPGSFYCIKDFQHIIKTGLSFNFFDTSDATLPITLINQNKTTKAYICPIPYTFKILVYAISTSEFSTNAKIVDMELSNATIDFKYHLWEIKYCFDNTEAATFCDWVNTISSKGAIYYLKDEYGNEANYDFKTIAYSTISSNHSTVLTDINTNGYQYHKLFYTFTKYTTAGPTELSSKITFIYGNTLNIKLDFKYTLNPPILVKTLYDSVSFYNNKITGMNIKPTIINYSNTNNNIFKNCDNLYFNNSVEYNEFNAVRNSIFKNQCKHNKVNTLSNCIFHNSVIYNTFRYCKNICSNLFFNYNNLTNITGITAEIVTGKFNYNNLTDVINILLWDNSTDVSYKPLIVNFENNEGNNINTIKVLYSYNSTNNPQKISVNINNNQFYNVNNLEIPGLYSVITNNIFRQISTLIVDYAIQNTFIQINKAFVLMAQGCEIKIFSGIATNMQNCVVQGNGILSTTFFFHLINRDINPPELALNKINLNSTENCINGLERLFASNILNYLNNSSLQNIANMMINYVVNNPDKYKENYIQRIRYGWIRNSNIKLYWGIIIIFDMYRSNMSFDLGRINAYPTGKYINSANKWMHANVLEWETSNNNKNYYLYSIKDALHQKHNIDEMETITFTVNAKP